MINKNDKSFEIQFRDCAIVPDLFDHLSHIRLAWIHLNQYSLEQSIDNITRQLKTFVKHAGAEGKYHETLTVGSIKVVHHFLQKSQSLSFESFIEEFPRLKSHFKSLLTSHYSPSLLFSEKAREINLEPDLLKFP